MKIAIGFRDELKAVAESVNNGPVTWSGPSLATVAEAKGVAESYTEGLTISSGEQLLNVLVARMNSYWWATPMNDEQ